ncbi:hypothetical protein [Piscirickettsia litoralis]|uniref:Uncharacterized protein n=1 Tax=Piscirickettsia litoralis TaxID=1891921 RepID=A0ABX2ZWP4_9GAMM|nr:hypothetical protein [Piscirickettsia litoralis]ODN41056.1 hypothetical protein BGC07_18075 [Piscirickettsia litoralis]
MEESISICQNKIGEERGEFPGDQHALDGIVNQIFENVKYSREEQPGLNSKSDIESLPEPGKEITSEEIREDPSLRAAPDQLAKSKDLVTYELDSDHLRAIKLFYLSKAVYQEQADKIIGQLGRTFVDYKGLILREIYTGMYNSGRGGVEKVSDSIGWERYHNTIGKAVTACQRGKSEKLDSNTYDLKSSPQELGKALKQEVDKANEQLEKDLTPPKKYPKPKCFYEKVLDKTPNYLKDSKRNRFLLLSEYDKYRHHQPFYFQKSTLDEKVGDDPQSIITAIINHLKNKRNDCSQTISAFEEKREKIKDPVGLAKELGCRSLDEILEALNDEKNHYDQMIEKMERLQRRYNRANEKK